MESSKENLQRNHCQGYEVSRMKFDIKKSRETIPQIIGESNKDYKRRCLNNFIENIIESLSKIQNFHEFNITYEYNKRKKMSSKIIIEFDSK